MSVDRILTMVDTSAKSTDPLVYKLNLLTRTIFLAGSWNDISIEFRTTPTIPTNLSLIHI